mmetsp:Transcript_71144/g.219586  ORF Transcript_71144/g.219586 Transcript_71144/m.219586 type:complete len:209 (-) Transcript_71144:254-880(-)
MPAEVLEDFPCPAVLLLRVGADEGLLEVHGFDYPAEATEGDNADGQVSSHRGEAVDDGQGRLPRPPPRRGGLALLEVLLYLRNRAEYHDDDLQAEVDLPHAAESRRPDVHAVSHLRQAHAPLYEAKEQVHDDRPKKEHHGQEDYPERASNPLARTDSQHLSHPELDGADEKEGRHKEGVEIRAPGEAVFGPEARDCEDQGEDKVQDAP